MILLLCGLFLLSGPALAGSTLLSETASANRAQEIKKTKLTRTAPTGEDMENLTYTLYLSLGEELTPAVIQAAFPHYLFSAQETGGSLKPSGYKGPEEIRYQIYRREGKESADAFSGALFSEVQQANLHPADRDWLAAQLYYSDTKIVFWVGQSIADFTRYEHVMSIKALCDNLRGLMLDRDKTLVANAFVRTNGVVQYYSAQLYKGEEQNPPDKQAEDKSRESREPWGVKPDLWIAESVFNSYPRPGAAFERVFHEQRELARKTAAIPAAQRARSAFEDRRYAKAIGLLEAIRPDKRRPEEAGVLGMAYYAQSYFTPNDAQGRQKALDTILAVNGEGNADWHYALFYVLYIADPAEAAAQAQKVLELGAEGYSASRLSDQIKNRAAQVERDRRIREEVEKNNAAGAKQGRLDDFDCRDFWEDSEYARKSYISVPASEADFAERVKEVQERTGYKLPASYLAFMGQHNGGMPRLTFHKTKSPTAWSAEGIAMEGFYAVGSDRPYSLLGEFGSRFRIEEASYPDIGVYIADTPTAGHDMIALDYRFCGPAGEPAVVHVAQEDYFAITFVAKDFATFIKGLEEVEE